jgi:hypothetical protein
MNDNEELNDSAVLSAVRDSITVPLPTAPNLEAITARGRAQRRHRLSGLSIAAGTAAGAGLIAGLIGSGSARPAPQHAGAAPQHQATQVQLAAFSVVTGSDGATTLTLNPVQVVNPDEVRQALAEHGIPALVTAGKFCRTAEQPAPGVGQVVTMVPLSGSPRAFRSGHPEGQPGSLLESLPKPTLVIHGSAIPNGVELSIGYRQDPQHREISFKLIQVGAPLICTTTPDNGPHGND